MAAYEAPLDLIQAAQQQAARRCGFAATAEHEEVLGETATAVLESAARLAREVLSPLNRIGDAQGARLTEAGVATAEGFAQAWRRFCADGWPALCAPHSWGGQALPLSASVGLATAPADGATVHAIIGAADARMYEVKANGRGYVKGS